MQSPLLASRSEEYRLLFRLPPDEVIRRAGHWGRLIPSSFAVSAIKLLTLGCDRFVLVEFDVQLVVPALGGFDFVGDFDFLITGRFL